MRTLLLAAWVATASPSAATAPSTPALVVELASCPAVSADEVRDVVAVELRNARVLTQATIDSAGLAPPATRMVVRCQGAFADLELDDPLTGKSLHRAVALSSTAPVAQTQLLGLAVVELVLASWSELEINPRPIGPPPAIEPAAQARTAAREVVRQHAAAAERFHLMLAAAALVFPHTPILPGAALALSEQASGNVGWVVDAAFAEGLRDTTLGSVSIVAFSAGLAAGLATRGRLVAWQAMLGLRAGGAWLRGTAADPTAAEGALVSGVWWGPRARVGAVIAPGSRLTLDVGLEAGWTARPVVARVEGDAPVAIQGPWAQTVLGLGLSF